MCVKMLRIATMYLMKLTISTCNMNVPEWFDSWRGHRVRLNTGRMTHQNGCVHLAARAFRKVLFPPLTITVNHQA